MNEATKLLYILFMGKEYKWSVISQYPEIELFCLWDKGPPHTDTIKYVINLYEGNYTVKYRNEKR